MIDIRNTCNDIPLRLNLSKNNLHIGNHIFNGFAVQSGILSPNRPAFIGARLFYISMPVKYLSP